MPLYQFINTETGEEFEKLLSISAREQYLLENPHIQQQLTTANFGDSVRMGRQKPDGGFRDILRDIKKGSGRGNTINTFD